MLFCYIIDMNLVSVCRLPYSDNTFDGLTLRNNTSFSVLSRSKDFYVY
jgi:hypothetical protein